MAVAMLPLDATAGSPSFTAAQTRQAFSAFLGIAPVGRPVGAVSGVRPGTVTTTVFMSGGGSTTWNVAAHSGVLDTQTSASAGPYAYATDGTDTGAITAANATNPRVDIVYVKVNDNVQDGSGLTSGQVLYLAGTAALSPSPPAVPARGMVLANINVPVSGGGAPTVSWVATQFGATPRGQAYQAVAQSIANGTVVPVTLDTGTGVGTVNIDTMWTSGANTKLTAHTAGKYRISGSVGFSSNATGRRNGAIRLNGSTTLIQTETAVVTAGATTVCPIATFEYPLAVGDYLELVAVQTSGAALLTSVASPFMTFLRAEWCGA
jgi:hypothetical protein